MPSLIAIAYPDAATAHEVRKTLFGLQKEYLVQISDAVVATHDGEKVKLDQSVPVVEAGAANGALWGGLLGLLFLNPLLGAAVGAAAGGLLGKATDYGIDDNFMREIGQKLTPGGAALFILANDELNDRVLPSLATFGGTVLQTSLSTDAEAKLRAAIGERSPAEREALGL